MKIILPHQSIDRPIKTTFIPQLCDNSPQIDMETILKLKKKIKSQKVSMKRLQDSKTNPSKDNKKKEIELVKTITAKYLPPETHYFFSKQLDLSIMKGKRWGCKDKSHALSLYHTSPRAYRLLQKQFALPSISTLRRTMQNLHIFPGFPPTILNTFKLKAAATF